MQIIFSFLYAPIIVFLLNYFEIKTVALVMLCFGTFWLLILRYKSIKTLIFPIFYIMVALFAFIFDDFLVFKFLPLLISIAVMLFLVISYFDNDSIILHFAKKIHKRSLENDEVSYINRCTFFWLFLAFLNIFFHISVLLLQNDRYWIIYSSFGWYGVFFVGGIIQYLHRKLIFLKRK